MADMNGRKTVINDWHTMYNVAVFFVTPIYKRHKRINSNREDLVKVAERNGMMNFSTGDVTAAGLGKLLAALPHGTQVTGVNISEEER